MEREREHQKVIKFSAAPVFYFRHIRSVQGQGCRCQERQAGVDRRVSADLFLLYFTLLFSRLLICLLDISFATKQIIHKTDIHRKWNDFAVSLVQFFEAFSYVAFLKIMRRVIMIVIPIIISLSLFLIYPQILCQLSRQVDHSHDLISSYMHLSGHMTPQT